MDDSPTDTRSTHGPRSSPDQYGPSRSDPSRLYYMTPGSTLPRPSPRRTKRHVPVDEKDEKYWEKRKRNNDAARRSRENKRRLDQDVRSRVMYLEEQLATARKELVVLKTKFRLPLDLQFLSTDSNGELIGQPVDTGSTNGDYSLPPSPLDHDQAAAMVTSQHRRDADLQMNAGQPHPQSPPEIMPVKKRRRGRKDYIEIEEEEPEAVCVGDGTDGFHPRGLLAAGGSAYPGVVWSAGLEAGHVQLPYPSSQMPSLTAAVAYQALIADQQRLPPINAFTSVATKTETSEEPPQLETRHQQQMELRHQQQLEQRNQQQMEQQNQQQMELRRQQQLEQRNQQQMEPRHQHQLEHRNQQQLEQRNQQQPEQRHQPQHPHQQDTHSHHHHHQQQAHLPSGHHPLPHGHHHHHHHRAVQPHPPGGGPQSPLSAALTYNHQSYREDSHIPRDHTLRPGYYDSYTTAVSSPGTRQQNNLSPADLTVGKGRLHHIEAPHDHHHQRAPQQSNHQTAALNPGHPHNASTHFDKDLDMDSDDSGGDIQRLDLSPDQLRMENNAIRSKLNELTAEVAHMKTFVLKDNTRPQADSCDTK